MEIGPERCLLVLSTLMIVTACCGAGEGEELPADTLQVEGLEVEGLADPVLADALAAHACALKKGDISGKDATTLTVIDYSLASTQRRLWVLDLDQGSVLFHERVAHGKNTGGNWAKHFSNKEGSLQSSLGVYRTGRTYKGKHGYSLRLDGLEDGINDNARERAIVMHGASYNSQKFIDQYGRIGRSWGCPALDEAIADDVIDAIAGGTLIVAHYPDEGWKTDSAYLNCGD